MSKPLEIVIDFDGTVVTHEYPEIGRDVGAEPVLRELLEAGHKLILFTMRAEGKLAEAVDWFKSRGIALYGVQENPTQKRWTSSPKAYGQLIIDDAALGCPLVTPMKGRPYADWTQIRIWLADRGHLPVAVGGRTS